MISAQQKIRLDIKARRNTLTHKELLQAENNLNKQFLKQPRLYGARTVASYIPCAGEISPIKIQSSLSSANIFLPRITHFNQSKMAFYSSRNRLIKNRYGIFEPEAKGQPMPLKYMDIIFVPLVAFDRSGNRLGMGGGFYDRALAFTQNSTYLPRPLLLGLAHHFQEVERLTSKKWDIPLNGILTDQEFIKITN